ncbi:MAG: aminotransferase class V-fold PLP-dependent enzyme [Puia sp.]|nr:aminotransferase class V-fold PLP-dependent enzyme [Puia sp.]
MRRRDLLKSISFLPFATTLGGELIVPKKTKGGNLAAGGRDLFKELGVRPFINAAGTYTSMTGSLMRQEVLEAIRGTSEDFCLLDELQDKVGEKIAVLVHSESAVVTAGAFSALTLGAAGVISGNDPEKVKLLPKIDGTGLKTEVLCQKAHAIDYNHAFTNTGATIVVIETAEELENAVNSKTALMHFLNIEADKGKILHEEWVALGKKHGIPTSIDIAADVPPVSNLWKFNDMGFDFVAISGGKALRGPQSAGLLMGKKEIITAARLHMPPRGANIGRGMKVNKEEIFGMYAALHHYINYDHDAEWKIWENNIALIENAAKSVKGVTTNVVVPKLGNVTPTLEVSWDTTRLSVKDLQEKLRMGDPSIEVMPRTDKGIQITVWVMRPGQEKIVAKRLKEELAKGLA